MKDERYVYGANCSWHGPIQEVASTKLARAVIDGRSMEVGGLPCCPNCGGMLMEHPNRAAWDQSSEKFLGQHPELDRAKYLRWLESLHSATCAPLSGWDWRASYEAFQ